MHTQGLTVSAPKPMEHRWGERVILDCPARLELGNGASAACRIRDASISGALIDTAVQLPVNTTLNVLLLSGTDLQTLELPACVARTTREGLAVEWRDMAAPSLIALLRAAGGDAGTLCTRC